MKIRIRTFIICLVSERLQKMKLPNYKPYLAPSRTMMQIILHNLMIPIHLSCLLVIQMKSFLYVVLFRIIMVGSGLYDMLI